MRLGLVLSASRDGRRPDAAVPTLAATTAEVAREIIDVGIRAIPTCVDPKQAPAELAGRWYDQQLLDELPIIGRSLR